ncbi:hypothetical protein LCGC14_1747110 [marine sediment metagenome]|uniref:Uncharacterized protein n=1 Tax=marine sediment metagenome TaxID=412755 RepID=A0A0F9JK56_9ZZZZ
MIGECINDRKTEVWMIDGKGVCIVKHPDPNKTSYSNKSRGRKIHLAKDKKYSVCNMLVDIYIPDSNRFWVPVSNGRCKVCFKGVKP